MAWIHPGHGNTDDNDLAEVKQAIDRAQLLYGGNGQVSIDSGLLRSLVENATDREKVEELTDELSGMREVAARYWALLKGMQDAGVVPTPLADETEAALEEVSFHDWQPGDVEAMKIAAWKFANLLGGKKASDDE